MARIGPGFQAVTRTISPVITGREAEVLHRTPLGRDTAPQAGLTQRGAFGSSAAMGLVLLWMADFSMICGCLMAPTGSGLAEAPQLTKEVNMELSATELPRLRLERDPAQFHGAITTVTRGFSAAMDIQAVTAAHLTISGNSTLQIGHGLRAVPQPISRDTMAIC